MFAGCLSLSSFPEISKWKTSNDKDINENFTDCINAVKTPFKLKGNKKIQIEDNMHSNLPFPNYYLNIFNGYFGPNYPMFNSNFQPGINNINNMNNFFAMLMGMNQMFNPNFQP